MTYRHQLVRRMNMPSTVSREHHHDNATVAADEYASKIGRFQARFQDWAQAKKNIFPNETIHYTWDVFSFSDVFVE